jgi:hypothetical protein
MQSLSAAVKFLADIERWELARLLERGSYERADVSASIPLDSMIYLYLLPPCEEAVEGLSPSDKKRILEAIEATDPLIPKGSSSLCVVPKPEGALTDEERLLAEVVIQRNQMIGVATGNPRIQDVDDYYRARRKRIREGTSSLGLNDPNPFDDLWAWYRHWKAELPTYRDRRSFINEMFAVLIETLSRKPSEPVPQREPTGWERVDRCLDRARFQFRLAKNEEDFQGVGLLCREVLISLAQAVYDRARHGLIDGVEPSPTDGRRMLEAFVHVELSGTSNDVARRHAKAALELAVGLQHRRTASFRDGAMCLEATSSVVTLVSILSGRRGPERVA